MNEIDKIIFQNFKLFGWDCGANVNCLEDLEVSQVAELMVKCLYFIKDDCQLPKSFPHNMSQKFRIAAKVAEEIKDLGYPRDLGYQSILYSNVSDLRRIFTFLIEKLPKDTPTLSKEPAGKQYFIFKEAKRKIEASSKRPWFPPHCQSLVQKFKLAHADVELFANSCYLYPPNRYLGKSINEANSLFLSDLEKSHIQSDSKCNLFDYEPHPILSTVLTLHSECVGNTLSTFDSNNEEDLEEDENLSKKKKEYFERLVCTELSDVSDNAQRQLHKRAIRDVTSQDELNVAVSQTATTEHSPDDIQVRISELNNEITQIENEIKRIDDESTGKDREITALRNVFDDMSLKYKEEMKRYNALQRTVTLVSNPQSAKSKLEAALHSYKEKEEKLNKQWMDFKIPLEKELAEVQEALDCKLSKKNAILKDISLVKTSTKTLFEEAQKKDVLLLQMKEEKERIPKGLNRSVYTKQILDICDKVQKQKKETQKVISETKVVQKDINTLTGKLQRTFAIAENSSYKVATENDNSRAIYRSIISIHEENGKIVDTIRECSNIQRETADLRLQMNSEKSKNTEENLKKLQFDLNNLREENLMLKEKQGHN